MANDLLKNYDTVKERRDKINTHIENIVNTEDGVHGIRYHDGKLSYWHKDNFAWVDIETGIVATDPPSNVSNITVYPSDSKLTITWTDPDDVVWGGTRVVIKAGSYPENENDGIVVVDNLERNKYQTVGFTQSGLTNHVEYFIGFFPYSTSGAVNFSEDNRATGTPEEPNVYGVQIDLADENPESCLTYTDGAIGMTGGSSDWVKVFNIKPCLFKDGQVVGYLNPNNYAQFEDGSSTADITSGTSGDVMVQFPRMGIKFTKTDTTLLIQLTTATNEEGYSYLAHTRGNEDRNFFYLGAYKSYKASDKLRSLSGKVFTQDNTSLTSYRGVAQANGDGYELMAYFQVLLIQVMYVIAYKNLNSQVALGMGLVNGESVLPTGGTNSKGLNYGESTGTEQMKLFGLEDFWGNAPTFVDGIYVNSSYSLLLGTDNFSSVGTGYDTYGTVVTFGSQSTYISDIYGGNETGFIASATSGGSSVYYCDSVLINSSRIGTLGSTYASGDESGIFKLDLFTGGSQGLTAGSTRIMYL